MRLRTRQMTSLPAQPPSTRTDVSRDQFWHRSPNTVRVPCRRLALPPRSPPPPSCPLCITHQMTLARHEWPLRNTQIQPRVNHPAAAHRNPSAILGVRLRRFDLSLVCFSQIHRVALGNLHPKTDPNHERHRKPKIALQMRSKLSQGWSSLAPGKAAARFQADGRL